MHRPLIDWDILDRRNTPGVIEPAIFTRLAHLLEIRKNTPEFSARSGPLIWDITNEQVLCFLRAHNQRKTLVLANLTDSPQEVERLVLSWASLAPPVVDRITGLPPDSINPRSFWHPTNRYGLPAHEAVLTGPIEFEQKTPAARWW